MSCYIMQLVLSSNVIPGFHFFSTSQQTVCKIQCCKTIHLHWQMDSVIQRNTVSIFCIHRSFTKLDSTICLHISHNYGFVMLTVASCSYLLRYGTVHTQVYIRTQMTSASNVACKRNFYQLLCECSLQYLFINNFPHIHQ